MKLRQFFLFSVALLINLVSTSAFSQSVEVRVQGSSRSNQIEIGQKFYIYVTVRNLDQEPAAITSVGGAEVLYWTLQSTSTSVRSINGQMSQSMEKVYAATLLARKKGNYSFGPITVGGVKSNVAKYSIVDAVASGDPYGGAASSGNHSSQGHSPDDASGQIDPSGNGGPTYIGKGNDQLFLRANVSKTTAYEQEALVYTVKLYTTYGSIKFIGATEAPKFDGFVIEESNNVSNELVFEQYQGRTYATAIIARYIIFPQMSGKLKILGNKYTVSTDAQEYYHDPFFSTLTVRRPIQLNVTPNDLEINVKALPTPRPANFSGGVGKFSLSSSLKSDKTVANQAGSITYTVSGEGNLKYINLPDLNAIYPDEIEVFSPSTEVKTNVGATNVSGSVNFDYSFMPLEQGEFEIPAVELVYFNPVTEKYESTKSKSYILIVAPGEGSAKSQATLTFNSTLMPVNVTEKVSERPYIRGFLYWLWFIIPTVILAGVGVARRKYIAIQSDIVGLKARRAGKMARKRLKRAASAMKENNEGKFYTELLKALWGYLSDKLHLPTSELTRDNVSQLLLENGIESQKIDSLVQLIDECEFAKYSPASLRKPMSDVYDDATNMLNALEENFSKNMRSKVNDESGDATPKDNSLNGGLIGLLLLIVFSSNICFASPETLIAEADSAYSKADYSTAIELYQKEIAMTGVSASKLFNLGCAYYKSGNEGEARLCLERAKRLDPSNSKINQDIQYIENRVQDANKAELKGKKRDIAPDNIGFFGRINRKIAVDSSSDTWASFAVMAFILLVISIAGWLFSPNVKFKKIGFFSGIIFLGFTAIFIIFSEMAASHFMNKDEAVVTSFKVTLMDDPHDANSDKGITICRGSKVRILESQLNSDGKIGWYKVELNNSNAGWVDSDAVTII